MFVARLKYFKCWRNKVYDNIESWMNERPDVITSLAFFFSPFEISHQYILIETYY